MAKYLSNTGLSHLWNNFLKPMIAGKVDKVAGKGLSSVDFTQAYLNRIGAVEDASVALANTKVDKVTGKGLSANDFTSAEKTAIANLVDHGYVSPTQVWSGTWSTGSITVPRSEIGRLCSLYIAGTGIEIVVRIRATIFASVTYYTGTELRTLMLKISVTGSGPSAVWKCEYFNKQTLGQNASNGPIVENGFSIGSISIL